MLPSSMSYTPMAPFDPTQPHTHFQFNHYAYNPSLANFYSTPVAPASSYYTPHSEGAYVKSESASDESPESSNQNGDPRKNPKYREKRARNNEAAKKSRLARKAREKKLQEENQILKAKIHDYEQQVAMLQRTLNSVKNTSMSENEYCSSMPGSAMCGPQPPAGNGSLPSTPFRETQNLPPSSLFVNVSLYHPQQNQ
ncbi:hypothetical protein WR25_10763 [Diploscapter pachys]|uniref:BZIP domain-containing protein n=1 Tax=Diploscapter pachys TaxID=2018661 RepID=A0A2A2JBP4_9BILA|nr:hypothetical protein WR25_10763 [Diploscapter pachys]